jgi:hypothetical protein
MSEVWILQRGEDHEGGFIIGVYESKEAAFADFAADAHSLHERFNRGLDAAEQQADGTLYLHSGCDWLTLSPHAVIGVSQITQGAPSA